MDAFLGTTPARPAVDVERRRRTPDWAPVAAAALFAVAVTLRITARYGVGAEPDTVTYLAGAAHLRAGHGFSDIGGEPLTLFPPLFPAAVAALEALGLAPLSAARVLNATLFGVLVVLAAVWARRITGSATVAAVVAGLTAISTPMVAMSSWALSEPLGIVTLVACLLSLTEALRTGGATRAASAWAAAAGLAAGLSCLTRYASVVLFPVGGIVLLARPGRRVARFRLAAIFGAAGVVPFGAWLARNVAVAGNATGQRGGTSELSLVTSLKLSLAAVGAWVVPGRTLINLKAAVGAALCLGVGAALVAAAVAERRREAAAAGAAPATATAATGPRPDPGPAGLALPAAVFVVSGVLSVAGFEATMAIDPPPRFLLPVFVPLLVGAAVLVAGPGRGRRRSWPAATAGLVVLVVAVSLPRLGAYIQRADRLGLLDYSTPRWRTSPLLADLKAHPVPGPILSNDPYILNLRLGVLVFQTPARTFWQSTKPTGELPLFVARAARAKASGGLSVVWFPGSWQPWLYSLADLERAVCLRVERHFADGEVLRTCP